MKALDNIIKSLSIAAWMQKNAAYRDVVSVILSFMVLSIFLSVSSVEARTDVFFMAPVAGQLDSEVRFPLLLKGERLQTGAIDFLYDSRYVTPVELNGNLVQVDRGAIANRGNPFFFAAARLDELYDETRSYLRTVRFSFAFQTPVTSAGVEELAIFHFRLENVPPGNVTLLQVIRNAPSMAELATYRQGGGAIIFETAGIPPEVAIESPENERRYEETDILLNGSVVTSGNATAELYWITPFAISEPLGEPIVATGSGQQETFEPGIHALWAVAADSAGGIGTSWTVFGVQEDVIVTILGEIDVTVIETTSSEPVSGATVILYSEDEHIITSCFTGADGLCVFEGLEEGIYRVDARKDFYDGYSATVTLPKDETVAVTLPILALVPPSDQVYEYSSVKICVHQESVDGPVVPDANVREIRGSYGAITGSDGCCYIDRVRQGVDLYWYAENGELYSELNGPVKFDAIEEELDIIVTPTSSTGLRLETVDPMNGYAPVASVTASLANDFSAQDRVTDSYGRAEFSPVSETDYTLDVQIPEESGPDGIKWLAGQHLSVSRSDVQIGKIVPLRLPFAGGYASLSALSEDGESNPSDYPSMEFHVSDQSGIPLNGVSVVVQQNGVLHAPVLTDGNGIAQTGDLLPGSAEIVLSHDGYQSVKIDAVLTAGISLTRYVRMGRVLSPVVEYQNLESGNENGSEPESSCPAVEITIKNPYTGLAVSGLDVQFFGKVSGELLYSGVLDEDGKIMFQNVDITDVPLDLYVSRAAGAANATVQWNELNLFAPIVVQEGYLTEYTFYFVPDATSLDVQSSAGTHPLLTEGRIVVKDETGHNVPDASVTVISTGDGREFNLITDETGVAEFQHDFPGVYHLKVLADGKQGMEFDMMMGIDTTYIFNVSLYTVPVIFRPINEACDDGQIPQPDLTASLKLSVVDATTGLAATGLNAELRNAQGTVIASGVTDEQGTWSLSDLQPIPSLDLNLFWQSPSGEWTELQGAFLDLKGGMVTSVSMFVTPGLSQVSVTDDEQGSTSERGQIMLMVTDTSDEPLSDIKVTVFNQEGQMVRTMYSNSVGAVSITDLYPGLYSIMLEGDGRLYMSISSVTIWQDSDFAWKAVLPGAWGYVKGVAEDAAGSGRLLALVVNGETFRPVAGVNIETSVLNGSSDSLASSTSYTDSFGRLSINGLDATGPVNLTLRMNNYMERHEGPVHVMSGETRYELYALTPEMSVVRVANPDNVPSGRTFWFPEVSRGVVQDSTGLTLFSYDNILMTMRKAGHVDLPDSSSELMATVSMPIAVSDAQTSFEDALLLAVRNGRSGIRLYKYRPSSGDAVFGVADINVAGDLNDLFMGYNRLAAATSEGLMLYSIVGEDGGVEPRLKSVVDINALHVLGSGLGLFLFTNDGDVVSLDISSLDMPVITGRSDIGFMPRNGDADWKYILMEDEESLFHLARLTSASTFSSSSVFSALEIAAEGVSGSVNTPSMWVSGQMQQGLGTASRPHIVMIGDKSYGFVMTDDGVAVVELTDNAMLQTAFYPMPARPDDAIFVKRRVNDAEEACMLVMTGSGMFTIPMPDDTDTSVPVDVDLSALLPEGDGPWYAWTSSGYLSALEQADDERGRHLYWNTELPAGIYDVSFVDSAGMPRFDFSGLSLFRQVTGDVTRLSVSVELQRTDGSRAGSFLPGQEIYVNMGINVWQDTVADGYLVVTYQPNGSETEYYCPAVMGQDGSFEITYCQNNMDNLSAFMTSWPAVSANNLRNMLIRLPEGDYGGAGMVSLFFTVPGTGSGALASVYDRADAPFRIGR